MSRPKRRNTKPEPQRAPSRRKKAPAKRARAATKPEPAEPSPPKPRRRKVEPAPVVEEALTPTPAPLTTRTLQPQDAELEQSLEDDESELSSEAPELGFAAHVVPPHLRFEEESPAVPRAPIPEPQPNEGLEAQIRALEARLDGLIRRTGATEEAVEAGFRERVEEVARAAVERITQRPATADNDDPVAAEYVARKWGREALRDRQEDVDDFGLDPAFEDKLRPLLSLLYRKYFRVQVEGIDQVPSSGAAVIVANHSGTLPLDGAMLRTAIRLDHPSGRNLRWLAEDFVFYLPFAGVVLNRIGAVRACPENAERLLEQNALVAVFPEGVHGIKKLYSERYRLQRFGRGGYIRLCLRTRVPLVPCAIVGAEETNPLLYRLDWPSALVKLPYVPITPTFPLLGPLGLLPVPTRWKIRFGEPISFDRYGPEAADDNVLVSSLSERVRTSIQSLIDGGLRTRKSVWFG